MTRHTKSSRYPLANPFFDEEANSTIFGYLFTYRTPLTDRSPLEIPGGDQFKIQRISHFVVEFDPACESRSSDISSTNTGDFGSAPLITTGHPDPTTCAPGFKWDPTGFPAGRDPVAGDRRWFYLVVKGRTETAQKPYAVKGADRYAESDDGTDGSGLVTVPTCAAPGDPEDPVTPNLPEPQEVTVQGQVTTSFPGSSLDGSLFSCRPLTLTLSYTNFATKLPASLSVTTQAGSVHAYAFPAVSVVAGTPVTVTLTTTDAAWSFSPASQTTTPPSGSSVTVALDFSATRTFTIQGVVRYNPKAAPSPTDSCSSLDSALTLWLYRFPDSSLINVFVGNEKQSPSNRDGTFTKSGIALGSTALLARVHPFSNLLDLDPSKFAPSVDLTAALEASDVCAPALPVCLHLGVKEATVCGYTKWELNDDTSAAGELSLEGFTDCVGTVSLKDTASPITGPVSTVTPAAKPPGSDVNWCFTVSGVPPYSVFTPTLTPAANAPYALYGSPPGILLLSTTHTLPKTNPLYVTRTFTVSGDVDFDLRYPAPSAPALSFCPAAPAASPADGEVQVTSDLTAAANLFSAGRFTINQYSMSASHVTVTLSRLPATPAHYLVGPPSFYTAQRLLSRDSLIAAYGSADLCTTGDIPAPCLSLGRQVAALDGQIWIEVDETGDHVSYNPQYDTSFDCAISVTVTAVGPDSKVWDTSAGAWSDGPVAVRAFRSNGTFAAVVLAGGSYSVHPATFACTDGSPTAYLAPLAAIVSPAAYPVPATADGGNAYHVDFPYAITLLNPPLGGCGHTLGYWKTNADRILSERKSQYDRSTFLTHILDRLLGYKLAPVLPMARDEPYIARCVAAGGAPAGRDPDAWCAGNWRLQQVIDILGSTSSAPKDLMLKQLLANEISFFAGYVASPPGWQGIVHSLAEWLWLRGSDSAAVLRMQRYLDAMNNVPPSACEAKAGGSRRAMLGRRLAM
ncbi:hypothetical protein HYH03_004715 [Edaphochlamys debaryana]|uniref:Uncharacterized protein n=1 Tax=Edaphochlamys debaryana TaxID=47281 RepID=A0A836C2Z1_9CHLO|nr:hypothetical protein HYH03_004715 [Edaphochlamys debaryana]|eukprot:KAG2497124.1 hypothetical protein HYH03_004715 [Edaphochlamys debaryana]